MTLFCIEKKKKKFSAKEIRLNRSTSRGKALMENQLLDIRTIERCTAQVDRQLKVQLIRYVPLKFHWEIKMKKISFCRAVSFY